MNIPPKVIAWIRNVFRTCNERVTSKLCNAPNAPEESLDLTWIETISHFATPRKISSAMVEIRTHYLGGLRHYVDWEVADIGLLLFIRAPGEEVNKVALLQSKRLYPTNNVVKEEHRVDFEIGFARIADPEDLRKKIMGSTSFEFTQNCRYGALTKGSDQAKAIQRYKKENGIPTYYQLYNPWTLPFSQTIPLPKTWTPSKDLEIGTLIASLPVVKSVLRGQPDGYKPRFEDFLTDNNSIFGWRLEDFITDKFLACEEGFRFSDVNNVPIQNLFYRRSGPIAAAIAISIDLTQGD